MINREKALQFLLVFCSGAILTTVLLTLNRRIMPAPIIIEPPAALPTAIPTATAGPIRIFVNGAVNQPDVYHLSPNSIVQEAIEQAGGFNSEANTAVINLALPLEDGMQIYVPLLNETAVAPLISDPGPASDNGESMSALVNINEASLEQFDALPGIGPATAQKILDFRDANGLFLSKEEIMLVSGIGEAKFTQIEALITVGE